MSKRELEKKAAELWIDTFMHEVVRDETVSTSRAADAADTAYDRFMQKTKNNKSCTCGVNEGCSNCPE